MLAGQVSQPVMRLAQLWTDFQQTGVSIQRLGDILNSRAEVAGAKAGLPPLAGRIVLEDVVFRYRPDSAEALKDINLAIQPGEVIGIVGRSGSGKSTLTRLIQRLYVPERGRVLVDGVDLALAEARACLHYFCRACCVPDCANQGARTPAWMQAVEPRRERRPSVIWSFQMSDKQRRVAQSGTQPEGPGCFAPRRRCQSLM